MLDEKITIAVDAAGGDYPHEVVKGAIQAAQEYNVDIALVGNKATLHVLAGKYLKKLDLKIIEASQVIEMDEHPTKAVREKPDSSIVVGVNLVRDGQASAFVSAGNTGACVCAALFNLGKIEGVERPALCCVLDITTAEPSLLIDAGANADCRPNHLVQFARFGTVYCRYLLDVKSPRVALLSNGEEETKGNHLILETYQLLKASDLNFIGNIEGHDLTKHKADVIVTDGFTGNIVLKTIEGLGDSFLKSSLQPKQILSNAYQQIGLGSLAKRADYREYGGVSLLGVKGNVVITHGRSQARAIKNSIRLAHQTTLRDIPHMISDDMQLHSAAASENGREHALTSAESKQV